MVAKDEGDTEEEQPEGDQEDQGELLLQVGHPAGLARVAKCQFFYTDNNLSSKFYPKNE